METRRARGRMLPDGSIQLRPSASSLALTVVPPLVPLLGLASQARSGLGPVFSWVLLAMAVVELPLIALAVTCRRIILHRDRLEHRNLWRSSSIPVSQIQAVTVGEGSFARPLQVWTADRRVHSLPAVTEADVPVIGDWWLAHRGGDWQPAWSTHPPAPSPASWWT